jgi:hypothetical protein
MSISAEEVNQSFRELIKALSCPGCEMGLTGFAIDWGDAYREGQSDLLRELGISEGRDGLFKIKCELCQERLWFNYFTNKVSFVIEESRNHGKEK